MSCERRRSESIIERPNPKRVSFARVVSICVTADQEIVKPLNTRDEIVHDNKSSGPSIIERSDISMDLEGNSIPLSDQTVLLDESVHVQPSCNDQYSVDMSMSIDDVANVVNVPVRPEYEHHEPESSVLDMTLADEAPTPKFVPTTSHSMEVEDDNKSMVIEQPKSPSVSTSAQMEPIVPSSSSRRTPLSLPPLRMKPHRLPTHQFDNANTACMTESRKHSLSFNCTTPTAKEQLSSHSLATTPLRQAAPKYWTEVVGRSRKCFTQIQPKRSTQLPEEVHLATLLVSGLPSCVPWLQNFGITSESLKAFLARHSIPSSEKENIPKLSFPDNLEELKQHQLQLYEELSRDRRAVEVHSETHINQGIYTWKDRLPGVLLTQPDILNVVEQLRTMTLSQRRDFFCESNERLHRLELNARQEYHDLRREVAAAFKNEQKSEMNRLQSLQDSLIDEETKLKQELDLLDTELKDIQNMESHWKNSQKQSHEYTRELKKVSSQVQIIREENVRLELQISEMQRINAIVPNRKRPSLLGQIVGATPLFNPKFPSMRDEESQGLEDIISPITVECVCAKEHTYRVRCLLGLVWFNVTCQAPIQELDEVTANQLMVVTVECSAPDHNLAPVDCSAVEALADYTIRYFTSFEVRSQLSARFVGSTLGQVLQRLVWSLSSCLLLAADLRAIHLAGHTVEFSAPSLSLLASAHKSVLRSTPARSMVSDASLLPGSTFSPLDRLLPPGPIHIRVHVFQRKLRSVVCLHFTLHSIDIDQPRPPTNEVSVVMGRFDAEDVSRLLETCTITPSRLYETVSIVHNSLQQR